MCILCAGARYIVLSREVVCVVIEGVNVLVDAEDINRMYVRT